SPTPQMMPVDRANPSRYKPSARSSSCQVFGRIIRAPSVSRQAAIRARPPPSGTGWACSLRIPSGRSTIPHRLARRRMTGVKIAHSTNDRPVAPRIVKLLLPLTGEPPQAARPLLAIDLMRQRAVLGRRAGQGLELAQFQRGQFVLYVFSIRKLVSQQRIFRNRLRQSTLPIK